MLLTHTLHTAKLWPKSGPGLKSAITSLLDYSMDLDHI